VFVPLAAGRRMPATRKDAGGVACHEQGPWRGLWVRGGRGDLLEAGPVPGDGLGGVLGQVMPQVPAVSDLDRAGGPVAGALGAGAAMPSAAASRIPACPASSSATWDSNPASVLRVLFG
jgi:hypothetical protein